GANKLVLDAADQVRSVRRVAAHSLSYSGYKLSPPCGEVGERSEPGGGTIFESLHPAGRARRRNCAMISLSLVGRGRGGGNADTAKTRNDRPGETSSHACNGCRTQALVQAPRIEGTRVSLSPPSAL